RRVGQILLVRVVFAFTTDQKESSKNHHAQHIRFHGFLPRQSADGLSHHPPSTCLASAFDLAPELKFKILQPEANHANKKRASGEAEAISRMVKSEWNLLRLGAERRCV